MQPAGCLSTWNPLAVAESDPCQIEGAEVARLCSGEDAAFAHKRPLPSTPSVLPRPKMSDQEPLSSVLLS